MTGIYALLLVGHVTTQAALPYNRSYRLVLDREDWVVDGLLLRLNPLLAV